MTFQFMSEHATSIVTKYVMHYHMMNWFTHFNHI